MSHTRPGTAARAARKARIARKAYLRTLLDAIYDQYDADADAWEAGLLTTEQVHAREDLLREAAYAVQATQAREAAWAA